MIVVNLNPRHFEMLNKCCLFISTSSAKTALGPRVLPKLPQKGKTLPLHIHMLVKCHYLSWDRVLPLSFADVSQLSRAVWRYPTNIFVK